MERQIKKVNYNPEDIVFLHIGKNAGTQIMHVARQLGEAGISIKSFGHRFKLSDLPREIKYFFSIRNPANRFISGFYSRKRKGMPRIYSEWSEHETIAFKRFEHANELAEDLFAEGSRGIFARQAIKSISHTGMQQIDWLHGCAYLDIRPPLTIIRQELFNKDMQRLLDFLNVGHDISNFLTKDKIEAHRNNYDEAPPLSDVAIANLEKWYIQDYLFYDMCEAWLNTKHHPGEIQYQKNTFQ
jgi:hypothetical protein